MDWNDFDKRLTLELSRLPVKSFLIVQGPSGLPYVQAMRIEGGLDAEAVGSAFLPRPLAPRQERRLTTLGWEQPDGEERRNWWNRYTWRERGNRASQELLECAAMLAAQMVGAFRDVYRIDSPLELVYQASKTGPEGGPLALPGLGIPLAVPEAEGRPAAQDAPRAERPSGTALEIALAEARERGDQQAYLRLLARATLYLPASGDPTAEHRFATAQFGDGTFVLAFTSPEAMDRSLQGQAAHHREATLSELSRHWPHPDWQLAVDPGLPSASYLDANALFEPIAQEPPAPPAPPDPSDVRVAGRSARTPRTAGRRRRPDAEAPRTAARSPQAPARPQGEPAAPQGVPAAAQAPSQPSAEPGALPRRHARPAPATRPEPTRPEPATARETPADPQGLPVPPPHGVVQQAAAPRDPQPGGRAAPQAAPLGPQGAPPRAQAHGSSMAPGTAPGPQPAAAPQQTARDIPRPPTAGAGGAAVPPGETPAASRFQPPAPSARTREEPLGRGASQAPAFDRAEPVAPPETAPNRTPADPPGPTRPTAAPRRDTPPPVGDVPHETVAQSAAAAKHAAPMDAPTETVVMQKVLRREHVQHYMEGGYDLVAGYVHRLQDVADLNTPAALIRGLGLVYEGSPFSPSDEEVFVVRWPAVKPSLFRRPLGGIDEWSMGIIPGGWVIEKAPFPGSGYAPGDGPAVPEFKIESQRLPHGAELYRLDAGGRESLVAAYDADLRRWLVRLPGGRG
ncbi:SseB family protein [Actinomadura violacea]|uniref:SseB family protein n=1 Tax=Actinomadura violacea TaxID=2819934 RepID=A0ABS3RR29_9ACTN|nr:SseB family protein [Actinomadura violacea]MBO2459199.1 SseB family protein [Actinomadura violacea]